MSKEVQVPSWSKVPPQALTHSWDSSNGGVGPGPLGATLLLAQLATVGTGREQGQACSQPGCLDGGGHVHQRVAWAYLSSWGKWEFWAP